MERENEVATTNTPKSNTARPNPSFRLRSPSLNTLRLRRVFDIFDHDSDGLITIPELGLALDRLGLGADPTDLASTVSSFIRPDHSGLEFEDFEALHRELGDSLFGSAIDEAESETAEAEADSDMEEAFRVFDVDGDGFISAKELHTVLGKLGMEVSMAKVHEMIYSVDVNCDGRVDFGEFKNMMLGVSVLGA